MIQNLEMLKQAEIESKFLLNSLITMTMPAENSKCRKDI
jgi:hypothetical protein